MPDSDSPAAAAAAHDIHAYLAQHERKELLRFLTCGSVDDGKSTLIGRLLFDSKMVYEDQLAAVKADSIKHGTVRDADFDPALLTDGLRAEREQGITIDVAYRYFSTTKRKFIIADTPGHEQYTRNMATGASNCDLAIILIDARHGVLEQTRRHSFIASLLGIRHVVVAINKMDLADWSESRYEEIRDQYLDFSAKLDLPDIEFIPMSALKGDNVVNPSDAMPWYTGGTLMHLLENVPIASDRNLIDMRFPVQFVLRPDLNFRGFAGTLAGGTLRPGDAVTALPSRQQSTIKQIIRPSAFATKEQGDEADGYKTLDVAYPPMAVTVTLEDEIDLSRGDMLVHSGNVPTVGRRFDAMIVWMSDEPMRPHHPYLVKHTSHTVPGAISEVRYRIDVNTFHRHDTEGAGLKLNEIGRCGIELAQPIAFDPYKKNRQTGGFILVDRMSNNTVAAGMILDRQPTDTLSRKDSDARRAASPHSVPHHPRAAAQAAGAAAGDHLDHRSHRQRKNNARLRARAATVRAGPPRQRARRPQRPLRPEHRPRLLPRRSHGKPPPRRPRRPVVQRDGADLHLRVSLAQ